MIERAIQQAVESMFFKGKAILLGPRQTGKTTLIQTILAQKEHLFLNADDSVVQRQLQDGLGDLAPHNGNGSDNDAQNDEGHGGLLR